VSGYLRKLFVCALLSSTVLLAQTSHRRMDPKPPSRPNPFEQLEKEAAESPQNDRARLASARERRKVNCAELSRELPQLVEIAQNLQKRLEATDLNATAPVDLQKQANDLERLARQIHKRVRGL
jgi:hypothetical protein